MIIVLANGCFDPLHWGHLKHLEEAKSLGDWLVVSVTADHKIGKEGHPVFSQNERAEMVAALRCVDEVMIVASAGEAIEILKPDVFVKGAEYDGKLKEKELVERFGGKCAFTTGPVYSSTKLLASGYFKLPSAVGG